MTKHTCLVLGFHPSSRGFGFALLEDERTPADWGSVEAVGDDKNGACLKRLTDLLDKYAPASLAMEVFDDETSKRSERVKSLCRAVVALGIKRKIAVHLYARAPIGRALGLTGDATREDVATVVAEHLEALKSRLPKHRRAWDSERMGMALFCAAACALCHYLLPPRTQLGCGAAAPAHSGVPE